MAIVYSQDLGPPSPALTNPDMILPYSPKRLDEDLALRKQIPKSINVERPQGDAWTPPLSSKAMRPSIPGAWQSEEDVRPAIDNAANSTLLRPEAGAGHPRSFKSPKTPKSPGAKFLNTLDPRLRAGLGVELPEYSPSIYSPTESEMAQKSPEHENGFDDLLDHAPDLEQQDEVRAILEEDDNEISMRAEEILANAKQRLTAMENNLNRARSLSVTRSVSATPAAEANVMGEDLALSSTKLRLSKSFSGANIGHSRVFSDTSVPNPKLSIDANVRSASAMGSVMAYNTFGTLKTAPSNYRHLEPLHEDELMPSPIDDYNETNMESRHSRTMRPNTQELRKQMQDLMTKIDSLRQRTREDSIKRQSIQASKSPSPFTNAEIAGGSDSFLTHSPTNTRQSREHSPDRSAEYLGEHSHAIQDFDSEDDEPSPSPLVKISTDENQDDNVTVDTVFDIESRDGTAMIAPGSDRSAQQVPMDQFSPHSQVAEFGNIESETSSDPIPSSPTYETDFLSPDLPPPSMPTPHEDRPDAFDYENYLLNPISFSRQGYHTHSRSSSVTSGTGSISTTRPSHEYHDQASPAIYGPDGFYQMSPDDEIAAQRPNHARQDSADSTSTTATFATAASAMTGRSGSRTDVHNTKRKDRAPVTANGFLSPRVPTNAFSFPPASRDGTIPAALLLFPHRSPKRNSFTPSPLPSPTPSNFSAVASPAAQDSSNLAQPQDARAKILELLLHGATPPLSAGMQHATPEPGLFWAPEDEALVGAVVDGLLRVCGRVIRGDEGGDGRGLLESIGAVLAEH